MNPDLNKLQSYPFEKLARLKEGLEPPRGLEPIALSIGEPRHPTPAFIGETVLTHLHELASYPATRGGDALREAIAGWLIRRYDLPPGQLDPQHHVLPVNGTREALFAFAQCVVDRTRDPLLMMPNPFYQIYEGAALLAGAEPHYLNCAPDNGFLPEFGAVTDSQWDRCQLLYICSPGNPTGAVLAEHDLQQLIARAERHDFIIASDECYSEIYPDEGAPPAGLLGAAARMGHNGFRRCVAFNSLSKRSNAPGLRSGFVAGDAEILKRFLRYRTYHGCAMAPPFQAASAAAWSDDAHVRRNRQRYREKFHAAVNILAPALDVTIPDGGFYLWPRTPVDELEFTRELYRRANVTVLPGSFLSRDTTSGNPGRNHVRMALVAPIDECLDAARRIRGVAEALAHDATKADTGAVS
ncbi:MAG: succinyldiaminopimelate transaminase [Pseudomonadota bacterium]|nr:succinyldiaminopimelate transaminase [Pseudomonadota bacterium]